MTTILLTVFALFSPGAPAGDNNMGQEAVVHRGAPFTLKDAVALDEVAKDPNAYAGKTVLVTGKVSSVCAKKGCWMVLGGTDDKARARITMKDYGFFAPFDAAGHAGKVEGQVEVKTLSEGERQHLADDAGKTIADIPAQELRVVATGLEIRKAGH
jgi:hypothetical protein